MMSLIEDDAGMSMLARARSFLVKFFLLLLISRELKDKVRDQSDTEGDRQVPDCPPEPCTYPYNLLNPSVTSTSCALFHS